MREETPRPVMLYVEGGMFMGKEMVFCKDCKYWVCKEVEGHIDEHYCGLLAEDMYAEDYCSRGEKK